MTTAKVFDLPLGSHPKATTARAIRFINRFLGLNNNASGWKVGAIHLCDQCIVADKFTVFGLGQMDRRVTKFVEIVGRNVCRHSHGNPRRAIGQKVRHGGRQNNRFLEGTVIVRTVIDGVLVKAIEQRLGHRGHARFGIALGRRVIAVDVAKVTLSVDQRVTHVEILREAGHCIVNRLVPVRVIIPHHIARDLGRFPEAPSGRQPQLPHRIQDSPVNRL